MPGNGVFKSDDFNYPGFYRGQVLDNTDPSKLGRIKIKVFGIFEDNYDKFFSKRCKAFSRELQKRIIPQEVDSKEQAATADNTSQLEME